MKSAFLQLHLSVMLAGFTGIFGRLITLSEGVLVFYRMLITTIIFYIVLKIIGKFKLLPLKDLVKIGMVGFLLAIHWVFFYGSIKAANVSVGVVCFTLTGFFTAVFEPIILRRKFLPKELFFSFIALMGVLLIFHFDTQYRTGIILGIIGAALAALYTICNKSMNRQYPLSLLFFYQIAGGLLCLSLIMPAYLHFMDIQVFFPDKRNLMLLCLFAIFCTIFMYMLQISALRQISAFTVNLSYNLEPIYTIALASLIFGEHHELTAAFFGGLGLIVLSVVLQMLNVLRNGRALMKNKNKFA